MKTERGIWVVVPLLIIMIALFFYFNKSQSPADRKEIQVSMKTGSTSPAVVIIFDDEGYTPNSVTINAGESIKWVNKSSVDFWPASNLHPTHSLYPDSGIFKCLTKDEQNIFDACRPISPGGTYLFTFKYAGEWKFHDHIKSNRVGTILVK